MRNNINRRDFLTRAGALAAGSFMLPSLAEAARQAGITLAEKPAGIQLFTVFEKMNTDPKGTLEQIAKIRV